MERVLELLFYSKMNKRVKVPKTTVNGTPPFISTFISLTYNFAEMLSGLLKEKKKSTFPQGMISTYNTKVQALSAFPKDK